MKMIKLLLVEDDTNLSYIIKSSLEEITGGYEVCTAVNGLEGLTMWKEFRPDVIVSDIDMPVVNGLEMVRTIRQTDSNVPIVFTTGKTASKDVSSGYESGADNYIKKPFMPDELDAHIRTLLRLKNGESTKRNKPHAIGEYLFEPKKFTLTHPGGVEKRRLTSRECQVLEMLSAHKGEIVKRKDILDAFWTNHDSVYASRSLDVYITKLRSYLSEDTAISVINFKATGIILEVI